MMINFGVCYSIIKWAGLREGFSRSHVDFDSNLRTLLEPRMFSARHSKYKEKRCKQSRKERRKQERAAKKAKTAAHFSRKRNISEDSGSREKPQKAREKRGRGGPLRTHSTSKQSKQTVRTSLNCTVASNGSLVPRPHPTFHCVGIA